MPEKIGLNLNNLGTVIHVGVLIVSLTLAYGAFDKRSSMLELEQQNLSKQQELAEAEIREVNARTERIERYLISQDKKYLDTASKLHAGKD